jgi:hypothetical protein
VEVNGLGSFAGRHRGLKKTKERRKKSALAARILWVRLVWLKSA